MEGILTPMNGHSLLLMEPQLGKRTFSDYPNVQECLDGLLIIFEGDPGHGADYTLDQVWSWLDQFREISLYVFVYELARYKKHTHSEFKELFITAIQGRRNRANSNNNNNNNINNNNNNNNNNNDNNINDLRNIINGNRNIENGREADVTAVADNHHNVRRVFRFEDRSDEEDDEENWDLD